MTKNENADLGIRCFCVAIALGIALMWPLISAAQVDSVQIKQLEEIRIQAKKLNQILSSPAPIQVLSGNDLKRINSLSVADAIRYFTGVQLKDYGGIGGLKTVNVRSMGSNHTAVFYNGLQLTNAQNGQVDLGKYALDNLEEISLVSGQQSNQLLPATAYTSASSIFLTSKRPNFKPGKARQMSSSLSGGSFGLANPSLLYEQRVGDSLDLVISAGFITANGRYKFRYTNGVYDTAAIRNNGDVSRFRLETSLYGSFRNRGKWNAQLYIFTSERGLPGAIVANKFNYKQRIWDRNLSLQGSAQQNVTTRLSLLVNAKISDDYLRYVDPDYITVDGRLDNRFHEQTGYLSAATRYQAFPFLNISFSSDYQIQDLKANIYRFAYPVRYTLLNVLTSSLKLNRIFFEASFLSTTVRDRVKEYTSAGNKQVFSPTFSFSWKAFSQANFRLRGFYKDIFRMPTFNDLYYTFVGNTLLNPEYAKQYDLGFTYGKTFEKQAFQFIELQADVYYNQIKDKIVAQPGANLARWVMYNIGKVDAKGVEANLKSGFRINDQVLVGFGINYAYQIAMDVSDRTDEYYRDQIPYIPKHSGSFLAKIDYRNWKFNYSFIYTGARYNQKANIVYNYMQPWYTHDAALAYHFQWNKSIFTVNTEVNNLLNQYYDVIPNFPMPGRNFRFSINISI